MTVRMALSVWMWLLSWPIGKTHRPNPAARALQLSKLKPDSVFSLESLQKKLSPENDERADGDENPS